MHGTGAKDDGMQPHDLFQVQYSFLLLVQRVAGFPESLYSLQHTEIILLHEIMGVGRR